MTSRQAKRRSKEKVLEPEMQESTTWDERSKAASSRQFSSPVNFAAELGRYQQFRAIRDSFLSAPDQEEEAAMSPNNASSDFSHFLCDEVMSGGDSDDGSKWHSIDHFKSANTARLSRASMEILQYSNVLQNETYDKPRSDSLLDICIESDDESVDANDPNTRSSIQQLHESPEDIGSDIGSEEPLEDICRVMGGTNSQLVDASSSHAMLHSLMESSTSALMDTMTDEVEKVSKRVVHQFLR